MDRMEGLIHARSNGQPDDRRAEDAVSSLGSGNGSAGPGWTPLPLPPAQALALVRSRRASRSPRLIAGRADRAARHELPAVAVSWTICLPSSMEPASRNTTVTASSVTTARVGGWQLAPASVSTSPRHCPAAAESPPRRVLPAYGHRQEPRGPGDSTPRQHFAASKHLQPPVSFEDPPEPSVRIDVSARVIRSSERLRSGIPSNPK
jgi:hypothetical protein